MSGDRYGPSPAARGPPQQWQGKPDQAMAVTPAPDYRGQGPQGRDDFGHQVIGHTYFRFSDVHNQIGFLTTLALSTPAVACPQTPGHPWFILQTDALLRLGTLANICTKHAQSSPLPLPGTHCTTACSPFEAVDVSLLQAYMVQPRSDAPNRRTDRPGRGPRDRSDLRRHERVDTHLPPPMDTGRYSLQV